MGWKLTSQRSIGPQTKDQAAVGFDSMMSVPAGQGFRVSLAGCQVIGDVAGTARGTLVLADASGNVFAVIGQNVGSAASTTTTATWIVGWSGANDDQPLTIAGNNGAVRALPGSVSQFPFAVQIGWSLFQTVATDKLDNRLLVVEFYTWVDE